jgi:phosphoribosylformimino-5-aminoimidazole carboxamide ribotide isomerase
VFKDGKINYENLDKLVDAVGKEHVVLDLSCRYVKEDLAYYVVTDRWQKFTEEKVTLQLLDELSKYCDEFLIHAVDVEGKQNGIERPLISLLGEWGKLPVTYAGGISSFEDLEDIRVLGKGKLNVTIGSALDLFGGNLKYEEVLTYLKN